jgi:hypothetical protein
MSEIDDFYLAEDGLGLAAALRGGCVSASELLEAALARATSINSWLGALCYIDESGARAAVAWLDPAAPFAGVPFLNQGSGCCGRRRSNHRRRPLLCAERGPVHDRQ